MLAAGMLCSCTMLAPRIATGPLQQMPAAYYAGTTNQVLATEWWTAFGSEELNLLVSNAFSNNLSFAQTVARFKQANATASKLSAASFPSLSASASAGQTESERQAGDGSITSVSADTYALGFAAGYEVDLWGRVHASRNSAGLAAKASFLDLETSAMSLSARISEVWIQLIEARSLVDLIGKQIEANSSSLEILKERAAKSSTTLLDVYQQEQLLRTSESRLPAAKQKRELLENELSILLGRHAGSGPDIATLTLPDLPAFPGNGIPADLLVNRPDVRAQLLRMKAAGYDVAAARADRLPAIRLSAKYDCSSSTTSTLFDNWASSILAGLTAPLIDGGQKRAEVRRARAALEEDVAAYRAVILQAFKEVQDAIIREQRSLETTAALIKQLESSRKALDEANSRYRNGNAGYLSVLTALRASFQTEQDLLSANAALLQARIGLHRALGGKWTRQTAEAALEADFTGNTETSAKETP